MTSTEKKQEIKFREVYLSDLKLVMNLYHGDLTSIKRGNTSGKELTADFGGFGESSDFKMNPNMMYYNEFSEDLNKTIEFVNTKFKPASIVLYGQSMGTVISRMNVDNSKTIKGLILDSFVINPKLVIDRIAILKKKDLLLPKNASEYIQSNKTALNKPVLIFSGLKDIITKTEDYNDFLSKNPSSRMVTWDCSHLECFTSMGTEPNLYIVESNKFINEL